MTGDTTASKLDDALTAIITIQGDIGLYVYLAEDESAATGLATELIKALCGDDSARLELQVIELSLIAIRGRVKEEACTYEALREAFVRLIAPGGRVDITPTGEQRIDESGVIRYRYRVCAPD